MNPLFKNYFKALIQKKIKDEKEENINKAKKGQMNGSFHNMFKMFEGTINKIYMQGLTKNINKINKNISNLSIDYFEKLKAYYKLKKERYTLGRSHFKAFYLKRKELKYDLKERKSLVKNGISFLFVCSNLIYLIKNRKSDYLLNKSFNFLKYSASLSLITNFLVQRQLNRFYKKELTKYQ